MKKILFLMLLCLGCTTVWGVEGMVNYFKYIPEEKITIFLILFGVIFLFYFFFLGLNINKIDSKKSGKIFTENLVGLMVAGLIFSGLLLLIGTHFVFFVIYLFLVEIVTILGAVYSHVSSVFNKKIDTKIKTY